MSNKEVQVSCGATLSPECLKRVDDVEKCAEEVFGSIEAAHKWLCTRNRALGDVSPISLLDSDIGLRRVMAILNAIVHGGVV